MNFREAIEIVLDEAEVSAIGESTDENLKVLDACKIVEQFVRWLPQDFTNDKAPLNVKQIKYTDFYNDEEKMRDFNQLSKDDFLKSYSYLTEEEYNLTRLKWRMHN